MNPLFSDPKNRQTSRIVTSLAKNSGKQNIHEEKSEINPSINCTGSPLILFLFA
jgi:hypothetical protein